MAPKDLDTKYSGETINSSSRYLLLVINAGFVAVNRMVATAENTMTAIPTEAREK
jgi:hypothetical protein